MPVCRRRVAEKTQNMNAISVDLTVEVRSADGTSTEFYQSDEECIRKTLCSLVTPRLLTQPQLILASKHGVSTVPCRAIDMILARTAAKAPMIFPLIFPARFLDITEVPEDGPDYDFKAAEDDPLAGSNSASPFTARADIHTLGGWVMSLNILAMTAGTSHDKRQALARLSDLPIIPFRLAEGGIGLINPANVTRVSPRPAPESIPEPALPLELPRWTPSSRRELNLVAVEEYDH